MLLGDSSGLWKLLGAVGVLVSAQMQSEVHPEIVLNGNNGIILIIVSFVHTQVSVLLGFYCEFNNFSVYSLKQSVYFTLYTLARA